MASHECICQTSTRRMGLVLGNLCEEYDEIATMVERFGVDWDTELATVVFEVGPDTAFAGPAEVLDLLTGIIGPENVDRVRATWLGREPLASQMQALMRAESLTGFAPARTSPLAGILELREIVTWFQPILDRAGSVWGYECLMRAFTAEGETISPGQLIAWARQENLLFMLDRVCRETHIASAAAAAADEDVHFLINFLPSVIYRPEFCLRTTVAALEGTHLRPERVIFEVVETERVEDHAHLRAILQYYRDAGFKFALDDMGGGVFRVDAACGPGSGPGEDRSTACQSGGRLAGACGNLPCNRRSGAAPGQKGAGGRGRDGAGVRVDAIPGR